jgi:protein-L-isoaspartate(D-aspartate) O-methyltransferase
MPQRPDDDRRTRRLAARRAKMVERHIAGRGISDEAVLAAMGTVPREKFVPGDLASQAYSDRPLPIGAGQTISQPYVVAMMAAAAAIGPADRVLEIGTGSGYGAAVLGCIGAEVWTVERHDELARTAERRLGRLGFGNVHVVTGDGTLGWPDAAPYDAIVVTAGGPDVPEALRAQLAEGGRLVIPIGTDRTNQRLIRERRVGDGYLVDELGLVRFVPLVGEQGW